MKKTKTKTKIKRTPTSIKIERVFANTMNNVRAGKRPNVSGEMRKAGYSHYSSKALKITKTKTWQELLQQIDNNEILDTFRDIMREKKDKRARMDAAKELAKLKDLYPANKYKAEGFGEEIKEMFIIKND